MDNNAPGEAHEDEDKSTLSDASNTFGLFKPNAESQENNASKACEEVRPESSTSGVEGLSDENKECSAASLELSRIDKELDEHFLGASDREPACTESTSQDVRIRTCWDDSATASAPPTSSAATEDGPSEENVSTFTDSAILLKDSGIIYFDLPEAVEESTATLQMSQLMSTVLSDICSDDDSYCEESLTTLSKKDKKDTSILGHPEFLDLAGPSGNCLNPNCRSASTGDLPQESDDPSVFSINGVHVDQLPDDVLHYIFSLFHIGELCRVIAQVCSRWCSLVCDPIHWQELVVGHLSIEQLEHCLRRATLLKKLDLGARDELTIDETILFSTNCPQLQELNLAFCDTLTNTQLVIISENCSNLQQINLEGCLHVCDQSLTLLSHLPKLSRVNLSHCSMVQTEGVVTLVSNLTRITELNIDGIPSIRDRCVMDRSLITGRRRRKMVKACPLHS